MFNFLKKRETLQEKIETTPQEDFNDIYPVAEYFRNETGVTFEKQISILKSKVTSFCKHRDIYSFSQLLESIKSNASLKQELIDYLTTNETYFYREFKQIEKLVSLVKNANASVQILCAPSSTGEEPYSIAIALLEAGVNANKFSITAVDINSEAVEKAKKAIYAERNIRNLTPEILQKYFTDDGELYSLSNEIKRVVTFKIVNIFDDSFKSLGKFDYIFSRNMLIYFDKETKLKAKGILESLRKSAEHEVFFGHADLF
ncbi:MAG: CheR family methyltransferase [Campylobacterota bacterium]|nr:CheR family methyltransferase [Campylobacterota bacterium]